MPRVMKGLGTAILSTNKGVMTDRQARAAHVRNIDSIVFCVVRISDTCQHVSDRIGDMHAVNLLLAQLCFLPACFPYARDLPFIRQLSEADAADAKFAKVSVRAAADLPT